MTKQAMALTEPMILNGVNVTALGETIEAVGADTEIANFQFRATNTWMDGDHNRTTFRGFFGAKEEQTHSMGPFEVDNAEPPVLLGEGAAPNPVEYVLHALVGCLTTTMIYHAAARNIAISEVSSEIEGDLDLRGFLGMSEDVRKGFHAVRVKLRVKSDAMPVTLKKLAKYSPVFDIVSNSLPVHVEVETY